MTKPRMTKPRMSKPSVTKPRPIPRPSAQTLAGPKFCTKPLVMVLVFMLALAGGIGLSPTAFADPYRHHGWQERERHHSAPPPYRYRHEEPFFGHGYRFHHPHHPRCRERLVPYWNPYWQIWSERVERSCW